MSQWRCTACGNISPSRNLDGCPNCGADAYVEFNGRAPSASGSRPGGLGKRASGAPTKPASLADAEDHDGARMSTGIAEFDLVCGGGLVVGSLLLLAGEPGIGKSTLTMGVFAGLVAQGHRAIYFTGEETRSQLRLRAKRLNLDLDRLLVVRTEDATEVAATIEEERPDVVIVDSIQTMRANGDTVPGGAASVREVASILQEVGKRTNTTIILIGHVTKESVIAGPKTLEHIVDAVLLLEGERSGSLRRLRSTKNRYGATDETSLFEMRDSGMVGVDSAVPVLADGGTAFGRVICPVFEGSRAMLVEVQALVAKAAYSSARRVAIGVPEKQVSMLLAVLERYADLDLSAHDVYVAVQSGIVVNERAIDAAICAAVASSARSHAIDATTVTLGEVGLNGGVRHVNAMTSRLKEAAKHDFVRAIGPHSDDPKSGLLYTEVSEVRALLDALGLMDGVVVEGRKAAAFWGGRSGRSGSRDESDDD